ncbi:serine hydrolase domain-containing protein [Mucisphaera sp.]|uniref:serine hydrolase domain-containing protein n=1 Tax=Mucisphaera sp. TaxID=2913024 RepID=UPI003D11F607
MGPLIFLVGCATVQSERPSHSDCVSASEYAGPALRAPIEASVAALRPDSISGLSPAEQARLRDAVERSVAETGAISMDVAVWQAGGESFRASHGTPDGHRHYWASVGKIITAAAVLRLEADGLLSLNDPISEYVDQVPNGDIITIRMLMNHTSGLFSASEDPGLQQNHGVVDLQGVLEIVQRQRPYACPGAAWRYSNTGYTLLGAVIEGVTGRPYHEAAYDLILRESAASEVHLLGPKEPLRDIVLPAAEPGMDVRGPQAAGGALSDAGSMVLLLRDLMACRILPQETLELMLSELFPMHQQGLWYGLGVMVYDLPSPGGETVWIGHSGGVPGARAIIAFAPDLDAIVAVALTGEGSAEAVANLLFSQLEPLP